MSANATTSGTYPATAAAAAAAAGSYERPSILTDEMNKKSGEGCLKLEHVNYYNIIGRVYVYIQVKIFKNLEYKSLETGGSDITYVHVSKKAFATSTRESDTSSWIHIFIAFYRRIRFGQEAFSTHGMTSSSAVSDSCSTNGMSRNARALVNRYIFQDLLNIARSSTSPSPKFIVNCPVFEVEANGLIKYSGVYISTPQFSIESDENNKMTLFACHPHHGCLSKEKITSKPDSLSPIQWEAIQDLMQFYGENAGTTETTVKTAACLDQGERASKQAIEASAEKTSSELLPLDVLTEINTICFRNCNLCRTSSDQSCFYLSQNGLLSRAQRYPDDQQINLEVVGGSLCMFNDADLTAARSAGMRMHNSKAIMEIEEDTRLNKQQKDALRALEARVATLPEPQEGSFEPRRVADSYHPIVVTSTSEASAGGRITRPIWSIAASLSACVDGGWRSGSVPIDYEKLMADKRRLPFVTFDRTTHSLIICLDDHHQTKTRQLFQKNLIALMSSEGFNPIILEMQQSSVTGEGVEGHTNTNAMVTFRITNAEEYRKFLTKVLQIPANDYQMNNRWEIGFALSTN